MKKYMFLKCLALGVVVSSAAFAGSLKAESGLKTMLGERELLPKIGVPDSARSKRAKSSLSSWYDPQRGLIPSSSRTVPVSPTTKARLKLNINGVWGVALGLFAIFGMPFLIAKIVALGCRMVSGKKDLVGQFRAPEEQRACAERVPEPRRQSATKVDTCESLADALDDDADGWCYDAEDEEDTPKVPVTVKGDWKTFDMPDRHEEFFIHRAFHPSQMRNLRQGHVPKAMEDKWFWYMEGDTLFAHRSWTGFCIYRIDFSTVNYHKVTVNRNPDQHKGISVEEDRNTLDKLLDWWIRSPYDYYNEWLAETVDALKKTRKSSGTDVAHKSNSEGRMGGEEACRLRDRRKGLLWGLVVGDCLGSPVQFSGKDDHPWITEMVECPVFGLPPGYWTDDSSMAMCVMDSYVRKGCYDLKDIGNTFAKWFTEGYLSSIEGRAFDIGRATRAACLHIAYGHEYVYGQEDSQGNGSIMRFAPSYLIAQNESAPAKVMHEVSDLTHSSGRVREVVDKFARILDGHVVGRRTAELSPYGTREEVNNSGWAVSTLDAALWAFNTTKTFEDGMVAAVNLGGDSDSIGAVYGQIAGAFYGFDAIPKRWVKAVKTWESVDVMIDGFLDVLETNHDFRG